MKQTKQTDLIVFGGLPGTGKTTVSRALAAKLGAVYLRIDAIEQAMYAAGIEDVGVAGYAVAQALAGSNLDNGLSVVADCVNPVAASRQGWQETAQRASASLIEIEVVCSDPIEHRRRVEARTADIAGHQMPTWASIIAAEYEPWHSNRLILDTASLSLNALIDRAEVYVQRRA